MDREQVWRSKSDEEVIAAAQRLYDYTEDGERIIRAELIRRGLPDAPAPIAACSSCLRSIAQNHPSSECLQCGQPFPAEILRQLPDAGTRGPRGIRGWLLVPAFGLIFGPVANLVDLSQAFELRADFAARGYQRIYSLVMFIECGFLGFLVFAAVRFFRKKRNAPSTLIAFMSTRLVVAILLLVVEWRAGLDSFARDQVIQVVFWALFAGVWGQYYTASRRVRATFVN